MITVLLLICSNILTTIAWQGREELPKLGPSTTQFTQGKTLPLKNAAFSAIDSDILILTLFSIVLVSLSVAFFKRQI